ncbi:MAG TPA: FAD:protein FMN transferase [Verrucomicrobiota bacterium]|nr:FAD:protein FMN transferase [Verrucomicrobiota bacterium]
MPFETVTLARRAMNTRFEVLLHGTNAVALRAAGEAALDEIEHLEDQLSLYRPGSEIHRVNRHAHRQPVRVSPTVFRLLEQARDLSRLAQGAFDPTVAPLLDCWGFLDGAGHPPDPEALAEALQAVGMQRVELDPSTGTVRFPRPGMMLDLGAIGKGHALDRALDSLREAGVESAFLHGGTSSVAALGCPPDAPAWRVAIPRPHPPQASAPPAASDILHVVELKDAALGVSAWWTKHFVHQGRTCGHVVDPRTGEPVAATLLAAVVLPSAAEADALSTALLVLGQPGIPCLGRARPEAHLLTLDPAEGSVPCLSHPPA